jgi:hypothetical protein
MKLKDAREYYTQRTAKLSEVVRQLNFAGIAVIWLFRTGEKNGGIPYSDSLLWPLGLLVASATFDLLQYASASAAWGIFHRQKEKELKRNQDAKFHAPAKINWFSNFCFWAKTGVTVIAYVLLVSYIARYLVIHPQPLKAAEINSRTANRRLAPA